MGKKKKRKIVEKEIANLHFYFGQCDKTLSNVSSNQRSKLEIQTLKYLDLLKHLEKACRLAEATKT